MCLTFAQRVPCSPNSQKVRLWEKLDNDYANIPVEFDYG